MGTFITNDFELMKNSQSGMARNWDEDEGELFDDPLSDEEYADTQAEEEV